MKERRTGIMINEIPFSNFPVLFRQCGLDFYIIDDQHGGFDYREIYGMISAARLAGGIETIVRIPCADRRDIIKFLDMGADGLLLPMTNGAEDIGKVVKYAKYSPLGERGISTMRAHTLYNPPPLAEYMPAANARTKVYAQIETKEGVERIEEILSVEGVEGFLMGPNDLSDSYGCLGDDGAPQILAAIDRTAECARRLGKTSGIITANARYLDRAKEAGMRMFSKGSELSLLASGIRKTVADICK